jgi:hypothetical protein
MLPTPRTLAARAPLPRPTGSSPYLTSLASPLSRAALANVRTALAKNDALIPPADPQERHAAVLVPLCNIGGQPGILLELRASTLRSHSGEVRCVCAPELVRGPAQSAGSYAPRPARSAFRAGVSTRCVLPYLVVPGRVTYACAQMDVSFEAAALRETQEEIGILPAQVEILGRIGPPELSLGRLRVWPYVVRAHAYHAPNCQLITIHPLFPMYRDSCTRALPLVWQPKTWRRTSRCPRSNRPGSRSRRTRSRTRFISRSPRRARRSACTRTRFAATRRTGRWKSRTLSPVRPAVAGATRSAVGARAGSRCGASQAGISHSSCACLRCTAERGRGGWKQELVHTQILDALRRVARPRAARRGG